VAEPGSSLDGVQRLWRTIGLGCVVAAIALASAGCSSSNHAGGSGIVTNAAYVQQPASTGKTTVGYLDIRNNGTADELVSVSTSVGGTVELRGPLTFGVSPVVMHTVSDIPIPAGATTQLIPNSYHLLITGAGPMHDGKDITLRLTFARAGTMTILAIVTNPQNGGATYFLN
jgi:periplasmic copper chaperone A